MDLDSTAETDAVSKEFEVESIDLDSVTEAVADSVEERAVKDSMT